MALRTPNAVLDFEPCDARGKALGELLVSRDPKMVACVRSLDAPEPGARLAGSTDQRVDQCPTAVVEGCWLPRHVLEWVEQKLCACFTSLGSVLLAQRPLGQVAKRRGDVVAELAGFVALPFAAQRLPRLDDRGGERQKSEVRPCEWEVQVWARLRRVQGRDFGHETPEVELAKEPLLHEQREESR